MPSTPTRQPDRADPDWEPNDVLVKLYVTRSVAAALDRFAEDLKLSKSLLVREALRRGLPALVNDVRYLEANGYQPSTHLAGMGTTGQVRGVRGEGTAGARWAVTPDPPGARRRG